MLGAAQGVTELVGKAIVDAADAGRVRIAQERDLHRRRPSGKDGEAIVASHVAACFDEHIDAVVANLLQQGVVGYLGDGAKNVTARAGLRRPLVVFSAVGVSEDDVPAAVVNGHDRRQRLAVGMSVKIAGEIGDPQWLLRVADRRKGSGNGMLVRQERAQAKVLCGDVVHR